MALERGDVDSLFGDVETDSLFGDAEVGNGIDWSSLFMEDQSSGSGASTSQPQPQPLGPASFPALSTLSSLLSLPPQPALQLISPTPPREAVQTSQAQDVSTFPSVDQPRPGSDSEMELELELELALRNEQTIDPPQVGRPVPGQDAQECQGHNALPPVALPAILRPRQSETGPPPRIDLHRQNFLALLPHLQLRSKTMAELYRDLGLSEQHGKSLVREARRHLQNPKHQILLSGNQDLTALHVLKVTLVLSALSLLQDERVGERWFGTACSFSPKSQYSWPYDSTTIVLHFAKLLYQITRNDAQKARSASNRTKKRERDSAVTPDTPQSLATTSSSQSRSSSIDLTLPDEPSGRPMSHVASCGLSVPTLPRLPTQGQPVRQLGLNVSSLSAQFPHFDKEGVGVEGQGQKTGAEGASHAAKRQQTPDKAITYLAKVPHDAKLSYIINVMRSNQRLIPPVRYDHSGTMRLAGRSAIMNHCADLGLSWNAVSIEIITLSGPKIIFDDLGWDRAVRLVYDDVVLDGEIRVIVRLG